MTTPSKSRRRLAALGLAIAAAATSGPALATAQAYLLQFPGTPGMTGIEPVSVDRSFVVDDGYIRDSAHASAALDTGTLRGASSIQLYNTPYNWSTCNACPQVSAAISDSLTFAGPGDSVAVTLQLHLDGNYTIAGSTGLADIDTDVYMVLGQDVNNQAALGLNRYYSSGYANTPPQDTLTSQLIGNYAPSSTISTTPNAADGWLVMTVNVPTNEPVGVHLGLDIVYKQLAPTVLAAADFQNTAQAYMSLPAGYSYTSASGLFLSASPVPEPAQATLLAAGLALLALTRRRRSQPSPTR